MSARSASRRLAIANVALVLASATIGYLLVEAGYRFIQYRNLLDVIVSAALAQIPRDGRPSSIHDPLTGYRYRPGIEVGPASKPFPVHYRTNRHGLIAREDFPQAKPVGEFRIGVIGDSFTANVTSTLRWTDVVEDLLDASPTWRAATGARRTRVINFGLDGIGAVQFGAVARHLARPFDLDILVVNLITDDLIRRPHARGGQPGDIPKDIAAYVRTTILSELNWFQLYPEVLAVVAGPRLGLAPRFTLQALETILTQGLYYETVEAAAGASSASFAAILDAFPDALILLDTTYPEYLGERAPLADAVLARVRGEFPAVEWVNVMTGRAAPASRHDLDGWFNLPYDQHKNDAGVRAYGEAVAAFLSARRHAPSE